MPSEHDLRRHTPHLKLCVTLNLHPLPLVLVVAAVILQHRGTSGHVPPPPVLDQAHRATPLAGLAVAAGGGKQSASLISCGPTTLYQVIEHLFDLKVSNFFKDTTCAMYSRALPAFSRCTQETLQALVQCTQRTPQALARCTSRARQALARGTQDTSGAGMMNSNEPTGAGVMFPHSGSAENEDGSTIGPATLGSTGNPDTFVTEAQNVVSTTAKTEFSKTPERFVNQNA